MSASLALERANILQLVDAPAKMPPERRLALAVLFRAITDAKCGIDGGKLIFVKDNLTMRLWCEVLSLDYSTMRQRVEAFPDAPLKKKRKHRTTVEQAESAQPAKQLALGL